MLSASRSTQESREIRFCGQLNFPNMGTKSACCWLLAPVQRPIPAEPLCRVVSGRKRPRAALILCSLNSAGACAPKCPLGPSRSAKNFSASAGALGGSEVAVRLYRQSRSAGWFHALIMLVERRWRHHRVEEDEAHPSEQYFSNRWPSTSTQKYVIYHSRHQCRRPQKKN